MKIQIIPTSTQLVDYLFIYVLHLLGHSYLSYSQSKALIKLGLMA
jgi:hypothetical protein